MLLRKESKRGLIALAVLCVVGIGTFAAVASAGAFRKSPKDDVTGQAPSAPTVP